MNKKNFKSSFDDILSGSSKSSNKVNKTAHTTYHKTKATFVVRDDHLDKLKAIAFMERKMIKDVLSEALSGFFTNYQKENGKIMLPKK